MPRTLCNLTKNLYLSMSMFIQLWERLDQVLHGGAPRFLRGDAPEGSGARRRGLHVDRVCQQRQPNT